MYQPALNRKGKKVIMLIYGINSNTPFNSKVIANSLGVSVNHVSHLRVKGLKKIRSPRYLQEVKKILGLNYFD